MNAKTTTTLAVDLGGTRIKLGVVRDGRVLARRIFAGESGLGLARQLPIIADAFREMCKETGANLPAHAPAGIGFCYPGLTSNDGLRVISSHAKYTDAPALDLQAWARDQFALPVRVENDARVALLGEWQFGAGRGCDDLVMVTLGTGIGGAAMIDGKLLRGKHGQAGVLGGHLSVKLDGRPCACGNTGCAETEASGRYLADIMREQPAFAASRLARETPPDYAAVFRLAAEGDAGARAVLAHSLRVWGAAVVNLIHAFDPERVIIGGGIMASAGVILPAVRDHVLRHAHTPWGSVEIVPAALGDDFALLGCEVLVEGNNRAATPRAQP